MNDDPTQATRIVVVGPCAAGKSTLVDNLRPRGFDIRSCVQEHSGVPDLWRRFSRADVLIYLDASLATIAHRQRRSDWTQQRLDVQRQRLSLARAQCDFYLVTDDLTREQVAEQVEAFLHARGVTPESV
jgi:cytidylate kinase